MIGHKIPNCQLQLNFFAMPHSWWEIHYLIPYVSIFGWQIINYSIGKRTGVPRWPYIWRERPRHTEHVWSIYLVTPRSRSHVAHFKTVAHFRVLWRIGRKFGESVRDSFLAWNAQEVQKSSASCHVWSWSHTKCIVLWSAVNLSLNRAGIFNSTTTFTYIIT